MSYYYEKKTSTKAPIVYITDGADEVPLKSWEVEIAPTLTGKSAIECTQTGKNLMPGTNYMTTYFSVANNGVVSQITTGAPFAWAYANCIFKTTLPAGTYTAIEELTTASTNSSHGVQVFNSSNVRVTTVSGGAKTVGTYSSTFTLTEKTEIGIVCKLYDGTAKLYVVRGSSPTTYEVYSGTQYTVQLGRTIYGGEVDIVNSEGKDTTLRYELDENDSWRAYSGASHSFWHNVATGEDRPIKQTEASESICNYATYSSASPASAPDFSFLIQGGQRIVVTADSTIDTVDKFKTWLSSHNLVFVCPASTSTDFTFTPITPTPETALGVNNFWADEGDSQIVYYTQIESDDNYIIKESTLTSIANSIRVKTGNSAPIFVEDMADEISSIEMGGSDLLDLASQSTFDFTDDTYKTSALTIPDRMFNNNQRIRTVNISGIKTVESYAFIQCKATSLSFPDVETIGYQAFFQCRGASDVPLSIPNVVTIGEEAFKEAYVCGESPSYRFLDISKCVTIGNNAFRSTRINGFKMDSVETLGNMPWYGSWFSMTTVVFPKLKTAHDQMCRGMNFTNLVIGPDWESCGGGFAGYDMDWRNKYVYVYATTPPTMGGDFSLWKPPVAFYVPADSVDAYKAAPYWSQYASIILPLPSDHLTIDTWL